MRAMPVLVALVLVAGHAAAALPADTVATATRVATRSRLEALLDSSGKAMGFRRWYRSAGNPFNILVFYDRDLKYASRFEVVISVTRQNTIGFRAYPHWNGPGDYIELDQVRDPAGLMQEALRLSDQNFMFWGLDGSRDLFAGFTITLESGFPEEAVRIVLRSVPLVDESVGDLLRFAE